MAATHRGAPGDDWSVGRSIPQALIEVGLRGPEELGPRSSSPAAWALTTDSGGPSACSRTASRTPQRTRHARPCSSPPKWAATSTAARGPWPRIVVRTSRATGGRSQTGGSPVARAFVILVPAGMALAGLSVGDGRRPTRAHRARCWSDSGSWSSRLLVVGRPGHAAAGTRPGVRTMSPSGMLLFVGAPQRGVRR